MLTEKAYILMFFAWLVSWSFSSVLAAFVAKAKGRSQLGWFLGAFLIFSPLLALIALSALPRLREYGD